MKLKLSRFIALTLLASLFVPIQAVIDHSSMPAAQAADASSTTSGNDFNLAFNPPQAASGVWNVYLAGTRSGTATFTWPNNTTTTVNITPGSITTQSISSAFFITAASHGLISDKVTKLSSTVPITVYGCMLQASASDCTNFFPTRVLGTQYRALYAKSQFPSMPEHITLIGGATPATVTLTSVSALATSEYNFTRAGDKQVITLGAYQVWTSKVTTAGTEFSGMLIDSTAQIGFLNGAMCENFGSTFPGAGGACDNSIQMVPPVSTWGTTFYSVNYRNSGATGSGYRIVAGSDNTQITVSGDFTGTKTLNAGEIYQFQAFAGTGASPNKSLVIISTKPVLVGHYMFMGQYVSLGGTDTGDPSMSYLTPYQQYLSNYTVTNPSNFKASLIDLVVPNSVLTTLLLDGAVIPSSSYRAIAGTTWSSAQIQVASGTHNIVSSAAFGAEVYGAGSADSYAYTGGQNFSAILNVAALQINASSVSGTVGQEVCIPVSVLDASGGPVQGVRVDAAIAGVSSTTALNALADSSGVAQICYTGNAVGTDKVTLSANGYTAIVEVVWTLVAPVISYSPDTISIPTGVAISPLSPTNTGGTAASYAITSGALPAGLSLDAVTGVISGTPTGTQASTPVTITATNLAGTSTPVTVNIEVTASVVTRSIAYSPSTVSLSLDGTVTPITPTIAGSFTTWSISPTLPSGLTFNPQTGVITGKPNSLAAATNYTVTATAGGGSASTTLNLAVVATLPVISYASATYSYVKDVAISAMAASNSGSPATTWSISPSLPAGLSFNGSTGLISGTPTAASSSATYTVTATNGAGSGTTTFTIAVAATLAAPNISYSPSTISGSPRVAITAISPTNIGGPATYTISPALPSGLSINSTTGRISGIPSATQASASYTVTATNIAGSSTATISISSANAPVISYGNVITLTSGQVMTTKTPTNIGSASTNWSISPSLPSALNFNTSTGQITGTPAGASSTSYTVTATAGGLTGTTTFLLTISAAALQAPRISFNPPVQQFVVNNPIDSFTVKNDGGAIASYELLSLVESLPAGLTIDTSTGIISGTPTDTSTAAADLILRAINATDSSTATLSIQIVEPSLNAPQINPLTYQETGTVGVSFTPITPINSRGNSGSADGYPVTWTLLDEGGANPGVLPSGLTFNRNTGTIDGIPTSVTSPTIYQLVASNLIGSDTATVTIGIQVAPPIVAVGRNTLALILGTAMTPLVPVNRGGFVATYTLSGATLPAGLAFDSSTGQISGTPSETTTVLTLIITGSNANSETPTSSVTISLTIDATLARAPSVDISPSSISLTAGTAMTDITPTNSGGDVTLWSISPALPASLVFNTSTGTISGTANAAMSSTTYTVTGTNNGGSDSSPIAITVQGSPMSPPEISYQITSTSYFPRYRITPLTPTNIGGVITTWDVSPDLPAGLIFDTSTGVISGIPTELVGATDYSFIASNAGGTSGFIISIAVVEEPIFPTVTWVTTSLGALTQGAPVGIQLVATTATVYSILSGSLPAGLTLNSVTGVISGIPTGFGPFTVEILANNLFGNGRMIVFSGTVTKAAIAPTPTPTPGPVTETSTAPATDIPAALAPATPPTAVAPGNSVASVNGSAVVATLVPNTESTGMVLSAPGWKLNLAAVSAAGVPSPLNDKNQLVVEQGKFVHVSGEGFLPFSIVTTYIFSTPQLLGTIKTDANGSFSQTFPVPTSLETGVHNLQANGFSPAKEVRSATVGLILTRPAASAAGLITFDFNVYKISTQSVKVIKALNLKAAKAITIYGYAQNNRTVQDIRISLDRALEVKKRLKVMYPNLQINVLGKGAKPVAACKSVKNRCAVVVVKS